MTPALFYGQLWLIAPQAIYALAAAQRAFFDAPEKLPSRPLHPLLTIEQGVGIVAIVGPMMRRPDAFSELVFGATDTEGIAEAIRESVAHPDVQAVFLDIDSPGGTVNGTPELAQVVADAARQKPVYAFTAGQMCSAAYWVASQCDAIYASPSARVGGIGVVLPVVDSSEAFRMEGLKIEVFAAGKFKSAGLPGVPLTEEQRQWLQGEVEEIAGDFRAAVLAKGRKIPDEAMEGQVFSARKAQRFNLAGLIKDRSAALARLRSLHVRQVDTAPSAMSIEEQLLAAREQIQKLEADAAAREALLAEQAKQAEELSAEVALQKINVETLVAERDKLNAELAAARQTIESLKSANSELQAREQDIAKRAAAEAARILAESGAPLPAQVSPRGDAQTQDLLERFRAITDPKEQTAFWRGLTPQQKAFLTQAH